MNRSLVVAVLTVTMIIMMSTAGYSAAPMHAFSCDNCHGQFIGGAGYVPAAKSCVGCHNPMGEGSRKPVDGMANYFGSVPGQPATGLRNNHTYLVSYSTATPVINYKSSRSNTLPAQTAALVNVTQHNSQPQTGQVTCNRCHNAAGNTYAEKMLRATNAGDALCLDCHRPRIASNTASGTHPVNYRPYSSAYKSNTTAFRKKPLAANSNNPTSNLGNYFSSGKIVCSTCHAVHYGDSNSATLDNRSTANGFAQDNPAAGIKGQPQPSKGELLRTDPIGATANSINVCSSCHKETANLNHNGKGQNVQCDHCHGAHVDYTGDSSLPNIYLVRRDFSNMSTTKVKLGSNVKVIFNTPTSLRFMRSDNKGICQICHTPTPGVAIHDQADTRDKDCIVCHKHSNGFSAASCTSCHGQPPITSYVGGPNGKSSQAYTLDENLTPHATHADKAYYNFACKNCHYDGTKSGYHNTQTASFQSVFVDTAGSVSDSAIGYKNLPSDYNATARKCSNVYCHSNGKPRGTGTAYKTYTTPSWEYGRNKILGTASECNTCHGYGSNLVTNAHYPHVSSVGIKCFVCHNDTVNAEGGIKDRTKHVNGSKNISFVVRPPNYVGVFEASPFNDINASCTNSCHGSATPVWTDPATGACGTCHAVPATSGAHTFHFTGVAGPKLGTAQTVCANCHDFATGNGKHANGQIDVKGCTPCHQTTAIWTLPVSVTCESCHTGTASQVGAYVAPLKDSNATIGHGQYSSAALTKVKCTTCHNPAANHIGAGPTEKRLLIAGNDLCASCHTTAANKGLPESRIDLPAHGGSVDKFAHYTSTGDLARITTVRADACAGCHDTHGTGNLHNIRTTINGITVTFKSSTGLYTLTKTNNFYTGLCQVCHTKTKYYRNYTSPNTHYTSDCRGCHKHKTAMFAFKPSGSCSTCHGYPPVSATITRDPGTIGTQGNYSAAKTQDYVGGGGAHSVKGHVSPTVDPASGFAGCANCHNSSNHTMSMPLNPAQVNVVVDPKYKFNNATSIVYNANTCSNVSCHFKPSPNWVTGN